ncbi:MAG: UDP-N-acetylmuramoyl-L-alanine--D-glutamate ligase [Gaiellales bacterium]
MTGDLDLPRSPLVLGAARSGRAAARALSGAGLEPVRADDGPEAAVDPPCPVVEATVGLLDQADVLVKSPGVPSTHPVVVHARQRGLPIWSEVELGYRLLPPGARVIGVTGTNGKTTTTELVGAMLREAALPHVVCGNVGVALCDVAGAVPEGGIVVAELSSFQLEDVHALRCDAAAITNLTPDHLDRHGDMEAYGAAKLRIFERQDAGDFAILNDDDPWCAALGRLPGGGAVVRVRAAEADVLGFDEARLRGDHNRENVAVAAALARALGVEDGPLRAAVRAFAPVPHRLEDCGAVAGVGFWNDSKATNVDAALKALTAFPDGAVRIILGGSDKGADFGPLADALPGRVRCAYLTGPAGLRMAEALARAGVEHVACAGFDEAVRRAAADATAGEQVLLAPACASFDAFADYTARGDRFRALAAELGAA